jgi:hypothetical protein
MPKLQSKQLVVCIRNEGYPASLEKRKIYVALPDPLAEKHRLLRIIDESGDDYLYPKIFFRAIALPQSIKRAVWRLADLGLDGTIRVSGAGVPGEHEYAIHRAGELARLMRRDCNLDSHSARYPTPLATHSPSSLCDPRRTRSRL